MELSMNFFGSVILWISFGCVICQDPQNYFFTQSSPAQSRFVPSFQNTRPPSYVSGTRNSLSNPVSSYPEQLIFLNDDEPTAPQSTGFSQFAQHLPLQQTTRNPDYYDISPRPFGVPTGSQGFTRPKALRPSNSGSSSGFVPLSGHQTRTNIPHQQSQFLSHFNDQKASFSAPSSTSNLQPNRINSGSRPFAGSNSAFTRNRPFGSNTYARQQQQTKQPTTFEDDTSSGVQQQLPFRNTRSRFQPNVAKTTTTTSTTSTASTPSKFTRYNRFGSGRSSTPPVTEFRQSTPSIYTASKARLPVSAVNKTLFQPRRPVVISREINRPFGFGGGRITVNHNGSDKNVPNDINSEEKDDLEESEENDSVAEEIREQNHVSSGPNEAILDKLSLHEAGASLPTSSSMQPPLKSSTGALPPTAATSEKVQDDHTVILTSNFFLPGSFEEEEDEQEDDEEEDGESGDEGELIKKGNDEDTVQGTTHHSLDYDYDYVDEATTLSPPPHVRTVEANRTEKESTPGDEKNIYFKAKSVEAPEVSVALTEITTVPLTPNEVTTAPPLESSAEYDEDEEYEDEGYGSGVDGSGVDGSGIDGSGIGGLGIDGSEVHGSGIDGSGIDGGSGVDSSGANGPKIDVLESDGSKIHGSGHEGSGDDEKNIEKLPINEIFGREVISVVTTKSVINGSTAFPQPVTPSTTTLREEQIYMENKLTPAKETTEDLAESEREGSEEESAEEQNVNNTTESYVVIASIQTSRSINGARFLPFPAIEQEETKQTLSELERKIHGKNKKKPQQSNNESNESPADTSANGGISSSTETSPDEIPDNQTMEETTTQATKSTTVSRFVPNIRKFMPKTSSKPKINIDDIPMDDLTGLLPAGFKPRPSYKNKKLNKPTSTTPEPTSSSEDHRKPLRNSTIGRSYKNSPNAAQDVALAGLLPKGYRTTHSPSATREAPTKKIEDILGQIKFEDNLDKLLPSDYKDTGTTPKAPVTLVDDISKFLPPGFKSPASSTINKPSPTIKVNDDISKFLPPSYKPPTEEKAPVKIAIADDLSKFLPPGFKLNEAPKEEAIDISKLLPKDFKSNTKDEDNKSVLKNIEFKDASDLLPPGFKKVASEEVTTTQSPISTTTASSGFKVVFPKGVLSNKRPGQRLTTPRPEGGSIGSGSPAIVIKKGPPTRATTEFTGWPTPSTTPISIEKLLEQARTATVDISDLLPQTTTTSTTSTTTTTTPEPPRPTKPGHCRSDCDLAGTIKIIEGVTWKPELLDHNTVEWKNLAREVEAQLNEVYSNAAYLGKWYKKVRIDSFSKGSVLVDYFVELGNITQDVNTLEIKKLFHQALVQPPLPVVPLQAEVENETDSNDDENFKQSKGEKLVKETYLMGRFVVDPSSTDFIVIPKSFAPTVEFAEDDALIPHWAIVLIVVGVGSLCFVVIFGVTVLLSRQKRAKKTPIPLTADMMNDLKVNHMGGADNFGVDDFYNIDDAWNDTKQPIKPKRFTNSMHGSSASNIYDSWRSTRNGDYYYDSHNYTPHGRGEQYPPDAFADVHQMYTYNHPRSKYQRDYDPDF